MLNGLLIRNIKPLGNTHQVGIFNLNKTILKIKRHTSRTTNIWTIPKGTIHNTLFKATRTGLNQESRPSKLFLELISIRLSNSIIGSQLNKKPPDRGAIASISLRSSLFRLALPFRNKSLNNQALRRTTRGGTKSGRENDIPKWKN